MSTTIVVEVAPGELKPLARCSRRERRRGLRLSRRQQALIARWYALLEELGEAWVPRTPLVMRAGQASGDLAKIGTVTVPEWEAEIEVLKGVLEMKRRGLGSVN